MIVGYVEYKYVEDVMRFFREMCYEGVQLNVGIYMIILKVCVSLFVLKWGKEVYVCIRYGGFELDVWVGIVFFRMYGKCGFINEVRCIFDNLMNYDIIFWIVMIGVYV